MFEKNKIFDNPFEAISAVGITDSNAYAKAESNPGNFVRVKAGHRNNDGWALAFNNSENCLFGNWRASAPLSSALYIKGGKKLSKKEWLEIKKQARIAHQKFLMEEKKKHTATQKLANEIWNNSLPLNGHHTYLGSKWVLPVDSLRRIHVDTLGQILKSHNRAIPTQITEYFQREREDGEDQPLDPWLLVVPLQQNGQLWSLQLITGDGDKYLLLNGKKRGSYWIVNAIDFLNPPKIIGIAEGVATILSVIQNLDKKILGISAIDCGNLESVALNLFRLYPQAKFIFFADRDNFHKLLNGEIKTEAESFGEAYARVASEEIIRRGGKAKVEIPKFELIGRQIQGLCDELWIRKASDFNDFFKLLACCKTEEVIDPNSEAF